MYPDATCTLVSPPDRQAAAADMINLAAFVTPAGTRDEGGVEQPAYINFEAELLAPPAGALQVHLLSWLQ